MIFRDIKQHNKVYILDKMNVTIDEGIVTAVGIPQPNLEGKIVIDVTINVKDKQATYTIPEQLSVTRANNLVLATDQKDLIQELETMKTNAKLSYRFLQIHRKQYYKRQISFSRTQPSIKRKIAK